MENEWCTCHLNHFEACKKLKKQFNALVFCCSFLQVALFWNRWKDFIFGILGPKATFLLTYPQQQHSNIEMPEVISIYKKKSRISHFGKFVILQEKYIFYSKSCTIFRDFLGYETGGLYYSAGGKHICCSIASHLIWRCGFRHS